MNFDELSEILKEEAGVDVCPICGTPYEKKHPKQKTCGKKECKRAHKNKYLRERRIRLLEEDREAFNKKHAEAQRKYLNKGKNKEITERNIDKVEAYWNETEEEVEVEVYEDGVYYGKRQMQKTLAMIPKIDVSLYGKERKENDDVHSKDNKRRGESDTEGR